MNDVASGPVSSPEGNEDAGNRINPVFIVLISLLSSLALAMCTYAANFGLLKSIALCWFGGAFLTIILLSAFVVLSPRLQAD